MALDPAEYSVKDLREEVKGVDAPGELRDALDAERDGQDRKTAKRAIERRLEKVSEDGTASEAEGETPGESAGASAADPGTADETTDVPESGGERAETGVETTADQDEDTLRAMAMDDATRARERLDTRLSGDFHRSR